MSQDSIQCAQEVPERSRMKIENSFVKDGCVLAVIGLVVSEHLGCILERFEKLLS